MFVQIRSPLVRVAVPADITEGVGWILIHFARKAVTTETGHVSLPNGMRRSPRKRSLVGLMTIPTKGGVAINKKIFGIAVHFVASRAVGLDLGVHIESIVVQCTMRQVAAAARRYGDPAVPFFKPACRSEPNDRPHCGNRQGSDRRGD